MFSQLEESSDVRIEQEKLLSSLQIEVTRLRNKIRNESEDKSQHIKNDNKKHKRKNNYNN